MASLPALMTLLLAGIAPSSAAASGAADRWVAVRADTRFCVQPTTGTLDAAPCVRLTGRQPDGAVLARVIADHGDTVDVGWRRPERGTCLGGPPANLADLGLTLRVSADALLPLVALPTRVDLGGGSRLDLQPGQPVWPGRDSGHEAIRLDRLLIDLPIHPPMSVDVAGQPGSWTPARPMSISAAQLPLPEGAAILQTLPGPDLSDRLAAGWDQSEHAVIFAHACARLSLHVDDQTAPGGPPATSGGGIVGGTIAGAIPAGTVLTLPSGRPVGQTTTLVTLSQLSHGLELSSADQGARLTSTQGGRTCFALPTSLDSSLPWEERNLELCASSATLRRGAP